MNDDPQMSALESRLIELEIRSEERKAEQQSLEIFVRGYEARIHRLEEEVRALRGLLKEPAEGMPAAVDDVPPHY